MNDGNVSNVDTATGSDLRIEITGRRVSRQYHWKKQQQHRADVGARIFILEAVRVGLVPRVTRRLTGHERGMIRPGTIWVWEEGA